MRTLQSLIALCLLLALGACATRFSAEPGQPTPALQVQNRLLLTPANGGQRIGPGDLQPGAEWQTCLPLPPLRSGYRASTLAFRAERLQGRRWSWVKSWDRSMAEWLAFFTEIRDRHFVPGHSPAPVISVIETDGHVPPAVVSHEWYAAEYLQLLPSVRPDSAELDRVTLGAYLPSPGLGTLAAGARGRALRSLARLRSLPILSGVARAIPLRWQTRVKGWLLR